MSGNQGNPKPKITNDKAQFRMRKARVGLISMQPFFGTLALRMDIQEDLKAETMWVDGYTLGYNPEWVENIPMETLSAAVAQGVLHCALLHQLRRGNREVERWQKACDIVVNNTLKEAGFIMDDSWPMNPAFNGKSAEEVYELLQQQQQKNPNGNGQGGNNGQTDHNEVKDSKSKGDKDGNGQDEAQAKMEEEDWKQGVAQAAMVAKQQGKLPANLERMMEELLEPVYPWKDVLRRFLTEKLPDEENWSRPNRRFIGTDIYLPSKQSDETGVIVACIDTSGSIGQKELDEFGGELNGIVQDVRPSKVIVIYCDAQVNHVDEFSIGEEVVLNPHGGGGTDFRPPFKYCEEHNIKPHALVYLTDGYGAFPDENDVDFPTLWAINNRQVVPPWGEHIVLDFNDR
jgi:predicted metal-dependent peptidase